MPTVVRIELSSSSRCSIAYARSAREMKCPPGIFWFRAVRHELSEAALYKHFASKEDLVLQVLRYRMPEFIEPLKRLPGRAGEATVAVLLEPLARQGRGLLRADHPRCSPNRSCSPSTGNGCPDGARARTSRSRRWPPTCGGSSNSAASPRPANPESAAALLLGACLQRAFFTGLVGTDRLAGAGNEFARDIVITVLAGITPTP